MYRQATFEPKNQLKDKRVVVLGASSGIGLQVARQAHAEGANLVIVGRHADKLSGRPTSATQ